MMRRLLLLLVLPWMVFAEGGYDSMTPQQIQGEMAKIQARLSAAASAGKRDEALAIGAELRAAALALAASYQRKMPKAPSLDSARKAAGVGREDVGARTKKFYLDWKASQALLNQGRVERAFNAMEAIVGDSFTADHVALEDMMSVGLAIDLAQLYLGMVADADRAMAICRKAEDICDRKIGASPDPVDSMARTWIAMRQGVRNVRGQALLELGRTKELQALTEDSVARWQDLRSRYTQGQKPPYDPTLQAFLFGGTLNTANQVLHAADALSKRRGKEAEAKALYTKAQGMLTDYLGTLRDTQGPMAHYPVSRRATCQSLLGRVALVLGDRTASRAAYEDYLAQIERYHQLAPAAPPFDVYARTRLAYAELLRDDGEHTRALELTDAARRDFDEIRGRDEVAGGKLELVREWRTDLVRGEIFEAMGRPDEAAEAYRAAIETIEGFYRKMRSGQLKGALLEMEECREVYRRLIAMLIAAGETDEALSYLERSKSAVLLDMLRSLPLRQRKNWPPELLETERKLKKKMRDLKREIQGEGPKKPSGTRAVGVVADELTAARWEYDVFLRKVADQSQEEQSEGFGAVWYRSPAELTTASSNQAGRVVVTFFDDGEVVRAFVLRAGELTVHECGPTAKLEKAGAKLRRNIAARSKRWGRPARDLHAALIEPWLPRLEGAEELVVVPTGFLYDLPFACLAPREGVPLAARIALSVTSQASLVVDAGAATELPTPRLLVGDPDGSLPSARVEAQAISETCPDPEHCRLLLGEQATETELKSRLGHGREGPAAGVVHLATHGLVKRGRELYSTLTLAPDEAQDGALSVHEIFMELDLRETPVVVLSACNSALGAEGGGDEILGLSRAFQYAGARWVVASLWEVSDEASAFLMQEFHRALAGSGRVDRALAAAMAKTRAAKPEWAHPYYWAPFAAFRR